MAAVALAVAPGQGTAPGLTPAQDPSSESAVASYAKDGVVFRDVVLGERLLGAAIGDPGQAELSFDVRVSETGLRFSPLCYGAGPNYTVSLQIEGRPLYGTGCQRDRDTDPGADGTTIEVAPYKQLRQWGAEPGDVITVDVILERSQGADGPVPGTGGDRCRCLRGHATRAGRGRCPGARSDRARRPRVDAGCGLRGRPRQRQLPDQDRR